MISEHESHAPCLAVVACTTLNLAMGVTRQNAASPLSLAELIQLLLLLDCLIAALRKEGAQAVLLKCNREKYSRLVDHVLY